MYRALRRHRRAILIGSDCPALTAGDLRRAARLLCAGYRVVLSPTEDGGYALIAARHAPRAIFEGMAWGESQVFDETAKRLDRLGCRWRALRSLWDVDRPEDLRSDRAALPEALREAPCDDAVALRVRVDRVGFQAGVPEDLADRRLLVGQANCFAMPA